MSNYFKVIDVPQLHNFIETYPFATLVSQNAADFHISHIPVLLNRSNGAKGVVSWHLAKTNPHVLAFEDLKSSVLIFQGPHSYISPTWYKTFPAVPTWNYTVVHAYGTPEKISKERLENDLNQMIKVYEGEAMINSPLIPNDYQHKLMDHIVGFQMEITHLDGKFKLGQNRSLKDQDSMVEGLEKKNAPESQALAKFIRFQRSQGD